MKKALIILSGGLDSATVAAIAKNSNYTLAALSFDYGQTHKIELESVKKIIKFFQISQHKIITINPNIFQNSALTTNIAVPKNQDPHQSDIPITYVPARNIIFLSYALAYAESLNICDVFIGVNHIDYSGYPDCRPEFLESFEIMANLGTKLGQTNKINIKAPLLELNKEQIIATGLKLGVDYKITHSCYDPNKYGESCGKCDSCQIRLAGFAANNISDPIKYQNA
jgi:7-cyano-7-deazaguanine synthase